MKFCVIEYGTNKHKKIYTSKQLYGAHLGDFEKLKASCEGSLEAGALTCFVISEWECISPTKMVLLNLHENENLKPESFRILNAPITPSSRKEAQWKKEIKHKSAFI